VQRFLDLVKLERLDDRLDFFHLSYAFWPSNAPNAGRIGFH
jgi:hypothetical protein